MIQEKGSGFTVVELTIATAIFSTVLLVGLASFLGIGRVFYKGVTLTQTQSAAQQVLDRLSADIQFASSVGTARTSGSGSSQYICVGNVRYTYNLFQAVNSSSHDVGSGQFGLLRDTLPGASGCGSPFGSGAVAFNQPQELLGDKLRLSKLDILPAASGEQDLWSVDLTIAFGDDNTLQDAASANPVCNANLQKSQFCSVTKLNTSVTRGL